MSKSLNFPMVRNILEYDPSRFFLISVTRLTASTVSSISFLSYFTGLNLQLIRKPLMNLKILHISSLFKFKWCVTGKLLAISFSISFSPFDLSRISLLLEGFVTFWGTKSKYLFYTFQKLRFSYPSRPTIYRPWKAIKIIIKQFPYNRFGQT